MLARTRLRDLALELLCQPGRSKVPLVRARLREVACRRGRVLQTSVSASLTACSRSGLFMRGQVVAWECARVRGPVSRTHTNTHASTHTSSQTWRASSRAALACAFSASAKSCSPATHAAAHTSSSCRRALAASICAQRCWPTATTCETTAAAVDGGTCIIASGWGNVHQAAGSNQPDARSQARWEGTPESSLGGA